MAGLDKGGGEGCRRNEANMDEDREMGDRERESRKTDGWAGMDGQV